MLAAKDTRSGSERAVSAEWRLEPGCEPSDAEPRRCSGTTPGGIDDILTGPQGCDEHRDRLVEIGRDRLQRLVRQRRK